MQHTTFHRDGIVGITCAHDTRTVWRLIWGGPGSTHIYIGRCMNSAPAYRSVADGLAGAHDLAGFKRVAERFFDT